MIINKQTKKPILSRERLEPLTPGLCTLLPLSGQYVLCVCVSDATKSNLD